MFGKIDWSRKKKTQLDAEFSGILDFDETKKDQEQKQYISVFDGWLWADMFKTRSRHSGHIPPPQQTIIDSRYCGISPTVLGAMNHERTVFVVNESAQFIHRTELNAHREFPHSQMHVGR